MRPTACGRACGSMDGTTPRCPTCTARDRRLSAHRACGGHQHPQPRPGGARAAAQTAGARTPARSVTAAVLARSSGHCEVFTASCRYTLDRLVSRCRMEPPQVESGSPAKLFAACMVCAEIVICLDPQLATRAGYVVDTGRDPASVPFHWRGSRWVLLDRDGWLTEMREDARTA